MALALIMCCCNNESQSQKTEKPNKTEQKSERKAVQEAPVKSNRELYPEKYEGVYIVERTLGFLADKPDPKIVKSVAIINENTAKLKINYLDGDHDVVMKFDNGDWVLGEIDGSAPNQ